MKNDDIEDLFKKSFENYEPEVRPSVWKNIRIGLKWGGLALLINTFINKIGISTVIAVATSVTAIIGTVLVMNWTKAEDKKQPEAMQITPVTTTVVEKEPVITAVQPDPVPESPKSLNTSPIAADSGQKILGKPSNTMTEASKKEKEKIESVISKYANATTASFEFSPNGDSILDVFVVKPKGIAKMDTRIFNKKGKVVYKSEGTGAMWDGKDLQGKKAAEGVYFYFINAEGIKTEDGKEGKKYEQEGSIKLTR